MKIPLTQAREVDMPGDTTDIGAFELDLVSPTPMGTEFPDNNVGVNGDQLIQLTGVNVETLTETDFYWINDSFVIFV